MKRVEKVIKEVEQVEILCDLCGSKDVPRYSVNRVCAMCGRDTCGKCQHHEEFSNGVQCTRCYELEEKYQPQINEKYLAMTDLKAAWKKESLEG